MLIDNILGSIQCDAKLAAINAVLAACGLRARAATEPKYFDIVSGGRAVFPDPVVESELMALALVKLREAQENGRLPKFSLLATGGPRA